MPGAPWSWVSQRDLTTFHVAVGNNHDNFYIADGLSGSLEAFPWGARNIEMGYFFFGLYIILILTIISRQAKCHAFNTQSRATCITGVPDRVLLGEHKRLGSLETKDESVGSESREILEPIEIDTWFHIVSSEAAAQLVSDEMVTAQVSCCNW